jgi:hypothetical protein
MIPAQELLQMQTDAAAFGDTTCVIGRGTRTPNAQGGASTTPATVATVKVVINQPTASQLQNYQYLVGVLSTFLVHFPASTDVREEDTLLIAGATLTVKKVLTPQSYSIMQDVLAVEVI